VGCLVAIVEQHEQSVVVKIVYDGPAFSGKTTNLQQLELLFSSHRRSDLFTPTSVNERTQYFDWLQFEGGLLRGFRLRCQLISVPGQLELASRRNYLLRDADTVVFVCDCSPEGLNEALVSLQSLRQQWSGLSGMSKGLIVQANKQDHPKACNLEKVRSILQLDETVPIISAVANQGVGVKETAMLAMRKAADVVRGLFSNGGVDKLFGAIRTPEQLYQDMQMAEQSPKDTSPSEPSVSGGEVEKKTASQPKAPSIRELHDPPWPITSDFPHLIWPLKDQVLAIDGVGTELPEPTLMGSEHGLMRENLRESSENSMIFRSRGWCFKTSKNRKFKSIHHATQAWEQLRDFKSKLGWLNPPGTTLVLAKGAAEEVWLWTVSPWYKTLQDSINEAQEAGDAFQLGCCLAMYVFAVMDAAVMATSHHVSLDIHPCNFAIVHQQLYYLDDYFDVNPELPLFGQALMQRVEEHCYLPETMDIYEKALRVAIQHKLQGDLLARTNLRNMLSESELLTLRAVQVRDSLLEWLNSTMITEVLS
jgi:signal recognition particle receptor subunit beta